MHVLSRMHFFISSHFYLTLYLDSINTARYWISQSQNTFYRFVYTYNIRRKNACQFPHAFSFFILLCLLTRLYIPWPALSSVSPDSDNFPAKSFLLYLTESYNPGSCYLCPGHFPRAAHKVTPAALRRFLKSCSRTDLSFSSSSRWWYSGKSPFSEKTLSGSSLFVAVKEIFFHWQSFPMSSLCVFFLLL